MGIQRANPNEYVARYGAQLEDAQSLITHARQAGVVEDIVSQFKLTESMNCNGLFSISFSRLLPVLQHISHRAMKVINQVARVIMLLAMVLHHQQPVLTMSVVVFLQVEVLVLI